MLLPLVKGSGWDGDHARGPTVVPFFAHLIGAAAASRDDRTNSAWASHPPHTSLSLLSTRNLPRRANPDPRRHSRYRVFPEFGIRDVPIAPSHRVPLRSSMATAESHRSSPSPRCLICGKRFAPGEARIRRGLAAAHVECVERSRGTSEGGEPPRQSPSPREGR
jgi:hypothetical protein